MAATSALDMTVPRREAAGSARWAADEGWVVVGEVLQRHRKKRLKSIFVKELAHITIIKRA